MRDDELRPSTDDAASVDSPRSDKATYRSPRLEAFGSLRSATRGTSGDVGDAGNAMMVMSERSVKDDIVRLGQHPNGLGIYLFRYKAPYAAIYGAGRRVGVMADEVEPRYPEAIVRTAEGLRTIDYSRLFG